MLVGWLWLVALPLPLAPAQGIIAGFQLLATVGNLVIERLGRHVAIVEL